MLGGGRSIPDFEIPHFSLTLSLSLSLSLSLTLTLSLEDS